MPPGARRAWRRSPADHCDAGFVSTLLNRGCGYEKSPVSPRGNSPAYDLDDLLHPARAFAHPRDVVADADLTLNEKRAILATWASDACAVEAAPALRCAPGSEGPVSVDAILEALRDLDRQARASTTQPARLRRRGTAGLLRPFRRRNDTGPDHDLSA